MFFHAIIFAGSRGSCLNVRTLDRVFNLLPTDTENVNAMKQLRRIIIFAFYMIP